MGVQVPLRAPYRDSIPRVGDKVQKQIACGMNNGMAEALEQSAHANALRAPWYVKNVNELATSKGVAYTRHCECRHNPAALFTGALTEGSTVARPNDEDGVTCMVCHSIRQVTSTKGIGSYELGRPAVMLDAKGDAVAGMPSDQEILAHVDRYKAAVMQPLYRTSEYCAACHKAAIPKMLNNYKSLAGRQHRDPGAVRVYRAGAAGGSLSPQRPTAGGHFWATIERSPTPAGWVAQKFWRKNLTVRQRVDAVAHLLAGRPDGRRGCTAGFEPDESAQLYLDLDRALAEAMR